VQTQIREILSREHLSSSQFADRIGVQRSSVSHVLSGRNKPGFDFIYKVLTAFPEISGEWLITGVGDMYKGKSPSEGLIEPPKTAKTREIPEKPEEKKILFEERKQVKSDDEATKKRKIERVIVFYTDRTFQEYHTES
jgi:transcriptional regulator with XRE-family HTH domain